MPATTSNAADAPVTELGFADTLVRLAHLVDRVFAEVSRERDLTPQQAQLLCMLIHGPVGMGELGRRLHLEKSSLSGLVDRVVRRGLVRRVPDPRDRRACRIALTSAGKLAGRRTHDHVVTRLEALANGLSPKERRTLTAIGGALIAADPATDND